MIKESLSQTILIVWYSSVKELSKTVKKFGWAPDIVHCHGWMTSLVPLYLKTAYKNEPLFQNSKVIYSLYSSPFKQEFSDDFVEKATINNLQAEDLTAYQNGSEVKLHKGATSFSDAVIRGSEELDADADELLKAISKPNLEFKDKEEYLPAYLEFYQSLLEQEVE